MFSNEKKTIQMTEMHTQTFFCATDLESIIAQAFHILRTRTK